ncbi:MAG: flavin reductase [Burkholderiaceae bacterium]|nr:flavin reductase [Burkholderiaceae bacterium]
MVDKQAFRSAMASLGTAVNVVTAQSPDGLAGCTISAVCSVTDEPPTLMVCINRDSKNSQAFIDSGHLCINIVSADQQNVAQLFASRSVPMQERFAAASWHSMPSGAPALDGALGSLDCSIRSVTAVGTHNVLLCEVQAVESAESGDALIYLGRNFHRLAMASATLA